MVFIVNNKLWRLKLSLHREKKKQKRKERKKWCVFPFLFCSFYPKSLDFSAHFSSPLLSPVSVSILPLHFCTLTPKLPSFSARFSFLSSAFRNPATFPQFLSSSSSIFQAQIKKINYKFQFLPLMGFNFCFFYSWFCQFGNHSSLFYYFGSSF